MSRIFTVNGKDVDIDDDQAVQALTDEEFTDLFALVRATAPVDGDHVVPLERIDRNPGTGFIIANPSTAPSDAEEQSL
jgi:hypothetical protein